MKNSTKHILQRSAGVMLTVLLSTMLTSAQILAWQFGSPASAGNEATYTATTIAANLNTSVLSRGTLTASALARGYASTNYTASGTKTDAITNNRYMQFTVSAAANFQVSLSTLDVRLRRSSSGPNAYIWRYSTDGVNFTDIGSDISFTSTVDGVDQAQLNLSTIPALQNVGAGTTITFRLYAWGATATGGTFAIGRYAAANTTNSLAIGGTVAAAGSAPTVTTTTATSVTNTTASSGGDVTSDGGLSVSARGVAYDLAANPTIGGTITSDGTGTGVFTSSLMSFESANTQYFYRAYATNSIGTSYGSESSFITLANVPGAPTVDEATASTLDVTIDPNSNPASTEFAIEETTTSSYVQANGSLGAAPVWQTAATWGSQTVNGLSQTTTYTFHVKARNADNIETGFGASASGMTLTANAPALSTSPLAAFGDVCINVTAGPNTFTITGTNLTTANVTVNSLVGYTFSTDDITYTSSLPITQPGGSFSQLIYVRFTPTAVQSYDGNIIVGGGGAPDDNVAASGSGVNSIASVTTGSASAITATSATAEGTIDASGCSPETAYGIEYSTTNNFPDGTGTPVSGGAINASVFTASLTGLSANTTYYYKAYVTNGGGTAYGSQQSFTTNALAAPLALPGSDITATGFTANWEDVTGAESYRLDVSTTSDFVSATATTFAGWSFPTSGAVVTPDVANANNTTKTLTSTGGAITDVAGAGTRAASANAWQSGSGSKYWQVDVDATGIYNLTISSKQQSSNTGPRDFKLQYRIGAGAFIDLPSGAITVLNDGFTSGTVTDLALPSTADNQAAVSIRWIMTSNTAANGSAVASGGTSRIDLIDVKGSTPMFLAGYEDLTVNGLSQPVTGLTPGVTYYYRVRAFSTNSTSPNSNVISVQTTCDATVTASAGTNGMISPTGLSNYVCGDDPVYTITADACYSIEDVVVDGVSQGAISSYTFTDISFGAHTISANFVLSTFSITASSGPNGLVTPAGTSMINCGDDATYTITADAGYVIADVLVDGISVGAVPSYTFVNVQSSHTISATFTVDAFTITATAGAGGSITPNGAVSVSGGDDQSFTITADACYSIADVLVDGVTIGAQSSFTFTNVQANHTIEASFTQNGPYTITATSGANGSVTPTGASVVTCGANATYTITPATCYSVADVLVDGVSVGAVTSYTFTDVQTNHTISATFSANAPAATPTVTGTVNVCPFIGTGDQITYTATSAGATSFQWTLPPNVTVIGASNQASITLTFQNGFAQQANKQLRVRGLSACGNSAQTIYYLLAQLPGTPQPITGNTNVCPIIGTANTYTYTIPAVASATGYVWTAQAGTTVITNNGTSAEVQFLNGFTTSAITVQATNDCGTSQARSLTVTRINPSTPGLITGPTNVCANIAPNGTPATYSVPQVAGVSYTWTIPAGSSGFTGQGSNTVNFTYPAGYSGGTISVSATNGCGSSAPRNLSVTKLNPAAPSAIDVIQTATCPNRVYTYSVAGLPANATSVQWTVPAGGTINAGQGTSSITVEYLITAIDGNVTAQAVNNCGSSSIRSVQVRLSACGGPAEPRVFAKNTGLENSLEQVSIQVSPNPSTSDFQIKIGSARTESFTVRILDMQGRALKSLKTADQTIRIGSDLKPGAYILEVRQGKVVRTEKLLKF